MPDEGKNRMQAVDRPGAPARRRAMIFAVFAFALLALSFHGALDDFAREQVEATTTESVGIYALARGINAAISLLQTSEAKVPFLASIQVGALLDPVDDAVERLSSAMVWAIGSLFLQRIVLEIAASPVFKWTFLALGLAATSALWLLGSQRSRDALSRTPALSEGRLAGFHGWMIRAFVAAAIVRFIVPAFISASFLIGQMILGSEIEENRESLSSFRGQVAIDTAADSDDESFLDELSGAGGKIGEVVDMAREAAQRMTMLLAAVVIKNIVIPLVFLAIALKGSLPMIRYCMRLVPIMKQAPKRLQDSREQADREG